MTETADGRVYKRKRITNPSDATMYVDIPVLYQAQLKLMAEQAQEYFIYIDNSDTASRKVHVKRVTNNLRPSQYVDVERIDEWPVRTMQEQSQETIFVMSNNDPPPIQSDGSNNPSHEKTHIVRYFSNNDPTSHLWVDVELIDELQIKCMQEQAQEYHWFMKHPELGSPVSDPGVNYPVTIGFCDPTLELVE